MGLMQQINKLKLNLTILVKVITLRIKKLIEAIK